jgi:NAD-dependent dihydropyrimidine dehydrogenase PreA subunit
MSYIIGKACIGCIDASCIAVCPIDCIHGPIDTKGMGKEALTMTDEEKIGKQVYIHPIDCIKCGACVPECPVDAIYSSEKQAKQLGDEESIEKNYGFFGLKFN